MYTGSVVHRFVDSVRRYPDRLALTAGEWRLTYREMAALASTIRRRIREAGFGEADLIGVLTGDSLFTYASILAILANGSAYVPVNRGNPRDRIATILEDAKLDVVVCHEDHHALVDAAKLAGTSLLDVRGTSWMEAKELDPPAISEDNLAYIFFTSGSTGKPKGVPIRHRNLDAFMNVLLDTGSYQFSPEDCFLQMFELTFDLSVMSLFTPLAVGGCCCVVPEKGISYLNVLDILDREEITVALMVPSMLSYLSRFFDEIQFDRLRYSLFCGEALPQSLTHRWSKCVPNASVQNVYGPTEATIWCLRYDWTENDGAAEAVNGVVAIGRPIPGMDAVVVDELLRPVKRGERGEICLIGPQLADGYWRDEEKTEAAFVKIEGRAQVAYRTGDLGFVNSRDNFVYCGRRDHQVKIDGHRIELAEIEHHVRECTGRSMVAVVPSTSQSGVTSLALFIEAKGISVDRVKEHLQQKLPIYMQPRKVRLIESMPLNPNGKIDRRALSAM
jgi:D-alanine--poly(phosphoribitol) ligase subunit 1